MKKFLEAKEAKGYSYSKIAEAIGGGYPDSQSVCNILHGKRSASIELLTKLGALLGLNDKDIQEAFIEQQVIWTKMELQKKKDKLKAIRKAVLAGIQ